MVAALSKEKVVDSGKRDSEAVSRIWLITCGGHGSIKRGTCNGTCAHWSGKGWDLQEQKVQ